MSMMDKRALKILFDAHWSSTGWKPESERESSPEDFEHAKSKGVMFDPVELDHAQALGRLLAAIKKLNRRLVADAFLSSLSTRRLDWRSALGSYTVFQHLAGHSPAQGESQCMWCGMYLNDRTQDFNVLNFERFKWGGVRQDDVVYALMDLELFLLDEVPIPTKDDVRIFESILSAIVNATAGISSAALHTTFAKSLKSNKDERDRIVGILGYCGILGTPAHPGFSDSFVPMTRRTLPDRRFIDMSYPACWWDTEVGVNQSRLNEYFGHVL